MSDNVSPEVRSQVMRAVRSSGTTPESTLKKWMRRMGVLGWKAQGQHLPGRPDFFFPSFKLAVFVDGCFWHGCLRCYRAPKSHKPYWKTKLRTNRARDEKNNEQLRLLNWKTIRLWEHEVATDPQRCVKLILKGAQRKSVPEAPLRLARSTT